VTRFPLRWSGLALASGLALSCAPPEEPSNVPHTEALLELDLTEPLSEQGAAFLSQRRPGLAEAVMQVRELVDEPLAKGLFVRIGPHAGHLADVDEWAGVFEAYKAKKKPVHCHFDGADNTAYALAAHCDRLSMTPAGTLELVGLGAQVVHGRALLEMLGVEADLLQMGKYKGASEPFTRDHMSPELEESLKTLLSNLDADFRAHLAFKLKDRSPEAITKVIDNGPYSAGRARDAQLVDAVAFDDEARAKAKAAAGGRVVKRLFEQREEKLTLRSLLDALAGPDHARKIDRPHLGIVFLHGEIVDGQHEGADQVGGDAFVRAMRRMGDESDVRAVVLRIESPGGSALASDRMWHAVRRVAKRKPVIVSMGDVAASGGYYVASAGSHIFATPASIVGSIGVVGGKMVVKKLADKVGVTVDSLKQSKNAGWLSPFTPFNDGERALFEDMLRDTYERFLARVSEGRKKPVAELLAGAEGRVMGGARAKELGLVDEVGTLGDALALARKKANLPKDAPVEVWPENDDPFRALSQVLGVRAGLVLPEPLEPVGRLPHSLTQGALVSVLAELREPVAVTLPFALEVR
jgi:protease-4